MLQQADNGRTGTRKGLAGCGVSGANAPQAPLLCPGLRLPRARKRVVAKDSHGIPHSGDLVPLIQVHHSKPRPNNLSTHGLHRSTDQTARGFRHLRTGCDPVAESE